jgi:hypothetical protein
MIQGAFRDVRIDPELLVVRIVRREVVGLACGMESRGPCCRRASAAAPTAAAWPRENLVRQGARRALRGLVAAVHDPGRLAGELPERGEDLHRRGGKWNEERRAARAAFFVSFCEVTGIVSVAASRSKSAHRSSPRRPSALSSSPVRRPVRSRNRSPSRTVGVISAASRAAHHAAISSDVSHRSEDSAITPSICGSSGAAGLPARYRLA